MRELQFGDVLNIRLPSQTPQGREQEGLRPAIVVGLPERLGKTRFPVMFVVPVTSDRGQDWANAAPLLYPSYIRGSQWEVGDCDRLRSGFWISCDVLMCGGLWIFGVVCRSKSVMFCGGQFSKFLGFD